ncbi:hypothetical protein PANO111632_15755 [Paracoccus nototheniae]|uniref:Replication protein n=1 Tax=Paracoccus nototheniae TaxID=2489002 RepID=A0ABW4DT17_9RHOB|nr:hypothetical protein [Paracoccus nototheniae]
MENVKIKNYLRAFSEENIENTFLANAACGMKSFSQLDERCITISAHMSNKQYHGLICRSIFETSEKLCYQSGLKKQSPSHCGLVSFIDYDGSKFTSADRNGKKPHFHALLFFPHGLQPAAVVDLTTRIKNLLNDFGYRGMLQNGWRSSNYVKEFDRHRPASNNSLRPASLSSAVLYAAKDEVAEGADFGVYLPFDERAQMGRNAYRAMVKQRSIIMFQLRGESQWKIYRQPQIKDCM